MRLRLLLLFLLAFLALSTDGFAQTGVLLPEDNEVPEASGDVEGDTPDMGIGGRPAETEKEPSSATPPSPQDTGKEPSPEELKKMEQDAIQKIKSLPPVVSTTKGPVSITPGGALPKEGDETNNKGKKKTPKPVIDPYKTPSFTKPDGTTTPAIDAHNAKLKELYTRPPLIVEERTVNNPLADSYTKSLTVSVFPSYQWGDTDLRTIIYALGYSQEEVPQNCQLRLDPKLATDDKEVKLATGQVLAGDKKAIKYEGKLQSISLMAKAVCNKPGKELPQRGAVLMRLGDKYSIQLNTKGKCTAGPQDGSASSVLIQYKGDGEVKCAFDGRAFGK